MKTAVIAPSMLYLLYPLKEEINGYPKSEFVKDLVDECEKDIRGCFAAGAKRVSIDFTEGRLTAKNDPRNPWTGAKLLQTFIDDVVADDGHGLRKGFDTQLRDLADRLRHDPEQIAKVERTKLEILDHPAVHSYLEDIWGGLKKLILDGAADPDSDLRRSAEALTVRAGEVLRDDDAMRTRVNDALERLAGHVATHYSQDLTDVISTTIARWDTDETSRRLELQVGRDLQFIRINGTVVGALAGLAIYTLSQLF